MKKDELTNVAKNILFLVVSIILIGINLLHVVYCLPELYYIIFDYKFWRLNYTPFPSFGVLYKPVWWEYFSVIISSIFPLIILCFGSYFLFKKNRKRALQILLLVIVVLVINRLICYYQGYC